MAMLVPVQGDDSRRTPRTRAFTVLTNLLSSMFGYARTPHETYAGEWQSSSRGSDAKPARSAVSHSAVYTCINSISSDLSKLPLRVYRPRDEVSPGVSGGLMPHPNHPANVVLATPNTYQTSLQYLQMYFASKLYRGNTYSLVFRDARGVPQSVHILDPDTVTPAVAPDGGLWYHVKATPLNRLTEEQYVPARNIIHDRAVCLFHPLVGVSPLFAAAVSAAIGNNISDNSAAFFRNMSRASGVITSPTAIEQPLATRLKNEWDNNYAAGGMGKVAVLGSGLEWKPLTMTAVDAQLIEQMRFSVEDIGRVFRVPSFMLGDAVRQTYRNSEQSARLYHQGCLSAHIESAEQCFDKAFEVSGGSKIKFDLSPLFRMESDIRFETHVRALNAGIKSINEVRAEEGMPPVVGGEEPRLQMQYVPLSHEPAPGTVVPGTSTPDDMPDDMPDEDEDEDDDKDDDKDDKPSKSATDEDILAVRLRLSMTARDSIANRRA